jgi:hypothetical protein
MNRFKSWSWKMMSCGRSNSRAYLNALWAPGEPTGLAIQDKNFFVDEKPDLDFEPDQVD